MTMFETPTRAEPLALGPQAVELPPLRTFEICGMAATEEGPLLIDAHLCAVEESGALTLIRLRPYRDQVLAQIVFACTDWTAVFEVERAADAAMQPTADTGLDTPGSPI